MWKMDHKQSWLVKINGQDSEEWLNRICSQKIGQESRGRICFGAFLDYKANCIATFSIWHRFLNRVELVFDPHFYQRIKKYLEDAHFGENVSWEFQQGASLIEWIPEFVEDRSILSNMKLGLQGESYLSGSSIFSEDQDFSPVSHFEELDLEQYKKLRMISGFPRPDSSFYEKHILIESESLEHYAHDNKGCYPGQEVINKIRSIGQIPKRFCCFQIQNKSLFLTAEDKLEMEMGNSVDIVSSFVWKNENYFCAFLRPQWLEKMGKQPRFKIEKRVDFFAKLMNSHSSKE